MVADPLRWTRRAVVLFWVAWVGMYVLFLGQLFARVLQPHCAWLLAFVVVEIASLLVALGTGLWRLAVGPRRLAALTWLLAAALPVALIAAHTCYGFWVAYTRNHPHTFALRILGPAGEALGDIESRWRYGSWIEGQRAVLIGNPEVTSEEAVAAMDRHVERMETILGSKHPGKFLWVRGTLLGMDGRSMHGYAICGLQRRVGPNVLDYVDRHEAAHNVLCDQLPAMAHPPTVINEGWAELQSSQGRSARSIHAWQRSGQGLSIRELVSPAWYHNADYEPYAYGEVLVDYLVSQYGGPKLVEFCATCGPETIEADFQRVYGLDLEQLDAAFRAHVERTLYGKVDGDFQALRAKLKLPEPGPEGPELRKRLYAEYPAACKKLKEAYRHVSQSGTVKAEVNGTAPKGDDQRHFEFARNGESMRVTWRQMDGTQAQGTFMSVPPPLWDVAMPYTFLDEDAADWLTIPRCTITRVEEVEEGGKRLARVHFEIGSRLSGDALQLEAGWFSLAPDDGWALVESETQKALPGPLEPHCIHTVAKYGEKCDGVPVLKSAQRTDRQGEWSFTWTLEIEKTEFGLVPDLPPLAGPPVPRLPPNDHILAILMRESLRVAAAIAGILGLLVAVQIPGWVRQRRPSPAA